MELWTENRNVIVAAAVVLICLMVAMLIWSAVSRKRRASDGNRLGVSEIHELDQNRRLVLVRRDGIEHLVLIGGSRDLVIETNIGGSEHEARESDEPVSQLPRRDESLKIYSVRPARPPVFGDQRPPLYPVRREEPQLSALPGAEKEPKA